MSKTTHALLLGRLGLHLSKYSEAQTSEPCMPWQLPTPALILTTTKVQGHRILNFV